MRFCIIIRLCRFRLAHRLYTDFQYFLSKGETVYIYSINLYSNSQGLSESSEGSLTMTNGHFSHTCTDQCLVVCLLNLAQSKQSHTGCICLTFPHCAFSDVSSFVRLFSTVRYQMCPQMDCLRRGIVTLVAFV